MEGPVSAGPRRLQHKRRSKKKGEIGICSYPILSKKEFQNTCKKERKKKSRELPDRHLACGAQKAKRELR